MNRRDRRTRGKYITERLATLRNSSVLQDANLKELPQDVIDSLIAGTHENEALQKRYNLIKKLLNEMMMLEIELKQMQEDLKAKRLKGISPTHQPIDTPSLPT